MANDALIRRLTAQEANPFFNVSYTKYITDGDIRLVSAHDMRCFNGIDDDLREIFNLRRRAKDHELIAMNRAIENDLACGRDHKWRLVQLAIDREECDCVAQVKVVHKVYQLWKCTSAIGDKEPTTAPQEVYGWPQSINTQKQCVFQSNYSNEIVNLTTLVNSTGMDFRVSWTENMKFTKYQSLRDYVQTKYADQYRLIPSFTTDIDPFLFDLHHAVTMVENYGDEAVQLAAFADTNETLVRLDTCECARLLKCPNGTISALGMDDVYDCVKTSTEVLQRIVPIPPDHPRLLDGKEYTELSGTGEGVGTIHLEPLEVAIFTINATQLFRNLTYKDHYQISVYTDCKPCPPRYKCDLRDYPPDCQYPNNDNTTGTTLYDNCIAQGKDVDTCRAMPFFCSRRDFVKELPDGTKQPWNQPGCCTCERHQMPYYFEKPQADLGFPDNKHGYIQFSVEALARTNITVVLELMHGLYLRQFLQGFTSDVFDLNVFTPSRASYSPATPSSYTFISVIHKPLYENLMLPLNLPESAQRINGSLTYKFKVEPTILINRYSDLFVGDPTLAAKHGFIRNREQNSVSNEVNLPTSSSTAANATSNAANFTIANANDSRVDTTNKVVLPNDYFFDLYPVPDPLENVIRTDVWWTRQLEDYEFIGLPYFPFFSNCRGYDSNIFIAQLLESHPDCDLIKFDDTVEVNQYPWNKKMTPNADRCSIEYTVEVQSTSDHTTIETRERGITLFCSYEENLEGGAEKTRWYESTTDTVLFYLSEDPISPDDFVAQPDDGDPWGRTNAIQGLLSSTNLVDVRIGAQGGYPLAIPQEMYLNLTYYQMDPGKKRIIKAELNFGQLCTTTRSTEILAKMAKKNIFPCTINKATDRLASKDYRLLVSWVPLTWLELINQFAFTVDVYFGLFTLVGCVCIFQAILVWIINRLFTKMKKAPKFRFRLLLKNISAPPAAGMLLSFGPAAFVALIIHGWWHGLASSDPVNLPNAWTMESTAGDWLDQVALTKQRIQKYKEGRIGMCLVVVGLYVIVSSAKLMIPETTDKQYEDNAYKEMDYVNKTMPSDPFALEKDEKEVEPSEFWDPVGWKRSSFLMCMLLFMATMLVFWEFSYSAYFTENIYVALVGFKVLKGVIELSLEHFLCEKLLVSPFRVVLSITENLIAMGTTDFIHYTMFYFVNLTMKMLERLYWLPYWTHVVHVWPKYRLMLARKFRKRRRRTREQKALEEAEWRKVCERIDHQVSGVESVLEGYDSYCIMFAESFLAPFVMYFHFFFASDTLVPQLYGVKNWDLFYYALFTVFVIPSTLVLGTFQLSTLELVYGWKIYEYISYQKHRFSIREHRWQMEHAAKDSSIHPACQSLDVLCFSSQFYFLLGYSSIGMLFMMFGITIFMRFQFSPFGDFVSLYILFIVPMACKLLKRVCIYAADKAGLWVQAKLDSTLDDEIANKLALGAGRQRDLERERLELQALNSERFRHRFMERNRPWILQHLVELFTPRTLEALGPDGKPNVEYVRDVYHELMNMGEGRRLKDDRSDISSDGEDDLEKMRRNWSNVPVEGSSKDLALFWLAKARKRRSFFKMIVGILANNKKTVCGSCGKGEDGGYTMQVDLATEDASAQDPRALDRLIAGFEEEYGDTESDVDLWKAFFRKHATFITLCNVCLSALEQKRLQRQVKHTEVVSQVKRDDEFSSDEDDDGGGTLVSFEPLVVARSSVEGRVMAKWLLAARKRLGGVFPRENAKEQMEAYAKKMRDRKARKDKKQHIDSDEEDASLKWKVQINEASRAIAIKWVWQAREARYAFFKENGVTLRAQLAGLCDKIQEVDDWFYSRELRMDGVNLREEGEKLQQEQLAVDEDTNTRIAQTLRDFEEFEKDKRAQIQSETEAFQKLLAKDQEDAQKQIDDQQQKLLEFRKQKEVEFAEMQRAARQEETRNPAALTVLMNEHRAFLSKLEEEQTEEMRKLQASFGDKEKVKRDAFDRKLALTEGAIQSRKALSQHRVLSLRKECMNKTRQAEKAWQTHASGWMDKASRKVAVKEQEDADAKTNEKKRRKRVLLAE